MTEVTGACLCGGVKVKANIKEKAYGACHCDNCRKWAAGPYLSIEAGTDVKFDGAENISVFNSSEWGERAFCKKCGTVLFCRIKETGDHYMSWELVNDKTDWKFTHQVFIDSKPKSYEFSNKTHNITGAELFAMATQK